MVELIGLFCAAVVGIISSARITRLLTQDTFPPVLWLRVKWDDRTDGSSWNTLFHCHWCMSLWVTPVIGIWGWLSNLHTSWWLINGFIAASYVAGFIVERDEVE